MPQDLNKKKLQKINRDPVARLDRLSQRYIEGEKSALIEAIQLCGEKKIVMPEWVVNEFIKAIDRWTNFDVKTLDEAFDLNLSKGKHLGALKTKKKKMWMAYLIVKALSGIGKPIDEALEIASEKLKIGKTLTSEYYYEANKITGRKPPLIKDILRLYPSHRKQIK